MTLIQHISFACSIFQIVGLFLIVANLSRSTEWGILMSNLIIVSGIGAMINTFIAPIPIWLRVTAGIAGAGIVLFEIFRRLNRI